MKLLNKIKEFFKTRQFKYGSNALLMVLVVVGIIVLLNILVYQHSFRWDLTSNNRYSISNQTKKVLNNLEEKIDIVGFFKSGSGTKNRVELLLERYQAQTDNLNVTFIDPDKNPGKAKEYGINSYGTTVVKSAKRKKKISSTDLVSINRRQRTQSFKGEQVFTRALIDVTKKTTANIYFLTGHGEHSLDKEIRTLKENLNGEGYQVASVNLAKSGIPDNAIGR